MSFTHCVIRVIPTNRRTPKTLFFENWGTKADCMAYAKKAAKPCLKVCKVVPVVEWDKHGTKRERGSK